MAETNSRIGFPELMELTREICEQNARWWDVHTGGRRPLSHLADAA